MISTTTPTTTHRLTLLALLVLTLLAGANTAPTATHAAKEQKVFLPLLIGGQQAAPQPTPTVPTDDAANLADRREVIRLVNIERVQFAAANPDQLGEECGLIAVEHPAMMAGAQGWSEEMRRTGMRHTDSADPDWYERQGFGRFLITTENLATSQSASTVVPQWMRSEIHKSGIVRCGVLHIGVGNSNGYYTLIMGVVLP